ncbi:MAG: ankyrin repeat domain-containing protein [Verrucomicrobiota bacterium]|nr:ankyrin repeat domain-containing protein [Verrucomicrobiota bacterium]
MNKFKATLLIVAVGLIIPASFAQQEDKPISEQILGSWKHQAEPVSITFQAGGKGRMSIGGGQFGVDLTWKLLGTNKLSMTVKDPGTGQFETEVVTLEIAGDTVTTIDEQGDKDIFKRKTGKAPDSSLFEAAVAGNLEAVKQHIAAGTDLNQVDPNPLGSKGSSLQAAAAFGYTEVAVALIEGGADVNQKDKEGQTPLHTAALFCYPEIAQALLDNGADKTIKDNDGQTALEMVVFPWEIAKGIYELLDGIIFKPAGKPLDYNRIQKTRPQVAAIIRKAAINRNAVSAEARQLAEGEISLTNGDIIEGTVADVDQNGIVVRRDIGGFAQRANWMQLTQQSLKKIRRLGQVDPKRYRGAAAYAEPFIEPDESEMERNLLPGPVKGLVPPALPSSVEVSSKVAAFGSVGGLGLLVAIALASMIAGLGVAAFRESNAILAAGVSLFLPVIGPILFLVKPKVEYEDEYDEDEEYEEIEAPEGATMSDTGGGAVAGMMPEAKKMSFAQTGAKKSGLKPQTWARGDTRFDRSFFQNNFPNFFKTVLGEAERGFALALKTGKREYIGQRITRISGTDIHMELLNGKEQKISYSEIGTVDLRPK